MRHPDHGTRALVDRLPPQVLGTRARQELFIVIRGMIRQGRPLDPLTAAWEARGWEAWRGTARDDQSIAALALRLGKLPTLPGTAGLLGRGLLADYQLTRALGPGWIRQPDLRLGGEPKAGRGQARRTAGIAAIAGRARQL
jgi:hypothetical protein